MKIEWELEHAKRWASKVHEDPDARAYDRLEALEILQEYIQDLISAVREDIRRGDS